MEYFIVEEISEVKAELTINRSEDEQSFELSVYDHRYQQRTFITLPRAKAQEVADALVKMLEEAPDDAND